MTLFCIQEWKYRSSCYKKKRWNPTSRPAENRKPSLPLIKNRRTGRRAVTQKWYRSSCDHFFSPAKMKSEKWLWKFDWLCPRWFFLHLKFLWFKKGKKRERKMRVGKERRKSSRTENGKSKIEKRKTENRNFKISDLNIFLRFFVLEISKIKNRFSKREISKQENGNPILKNPFCYFWKWDGQF